MFYDFAEGRATGWFGDCGRRLAMLFDVGSPSLPIVGCKRDAPDVLRLGKLDSNVVRVLGIDKYDVGCG